MAGPTEPASGEVKIRLIAEGDTGGIFGDGAPPRGPSVPPKSVSPGVPPQGPSGTATGKLPSVSQVDVAAFLPQGFRGLTEEQQKQLKAFQEAQRLQKQAADYQKYLVGPEQMTLGQKVQKGFGETGAALLKWGAAMFGIMEIVKHSKSMNMYLSSIFEMLGMLVDVILAPLAPVFAFLLKWLAKAVEVWSWITSGKLGEWLRDVWENAITWMKEKLGPTWEVLADIVGTVKFIIKALVDPLGALKDMFNWARPLLDALWVDIKESVRDALTGFAMMGTAIWKGIEIAGTAIWNGIEIAGTAIWNGIDLAGKFGGAIKDIATTVADAFIKAFKDAAEGITKIWAAIQHALHSIFPIIPDHPDYQKNGGASRSFDNPSGFPQPTKSTTVNQAATVTVVITGDNGSDPETLRQAVRKGVREGFGHYVETMD